MRTTLVGHSTDAPMLSALRGTLDDADEAILCSAFVRRAGAHLVAPQLESLRDRGRLVATSVFGGASSQEGIGAIADLGVRVRVANPSHGTFHPKLYVARRGNQCRALIGSANLTGGIVTNVEVAALLEGSRNDPALAAAWDTAEQYWHLESAELWQPVAAEQSDELLDPALYRAIRREVERDPVFLTLVNTKPNRVVEATRSGLWIETEASKDKGRPPQEVPAWMLQLAWDYLDAHGSLTNRYLLATDGLNVKRSSAVCAILARLPGVTVAGRRPIRLVMGSDGPA